METQAHTSWGRFYRGSEEYEWVGCGEMIKRGKEIEGRGVAPINLAVQVLLYLDYGFMFHSGRV